MVQPASQPASSAHTHPGGSPSPKSDDHELIYEKRNKQESFLAPFSLVSPISLLSSIPCLCVSLSTVFEVIYVPSSVCVCEVMASTSYCLGDLVPYSHYRSVFQTDPLPFFLFHSPFPLFMFAILWSELPLVPWCDIYCPSRAHSFTLCNYSNFEVAFVGRRAAPPLPPCWVI